MSMGSIVKLIYYKVINILPKNNFGDKLFSIINFLRAHKRFPSNDLILSDYLFKIKHSDEAYSPLRAYITDKQFVKDYVTAKVGREFNVPTISIIQEYSNALEYDFPLRCCIKPTHLSGAVILRKDGEDIDFNLIKKWLSTNYYEVGREKNYRYLKPKLIVEPLIFDSINNEDFKFFCFNGAVKFVQVDIDRNINHTRLYFDIEWNELNFTILKPKSKKQYSRPANLEKLIEIADMLSADFEFIRVDLYTDGKKIYVGELTNWPENGNGYFIPKSSEKFASELLFGN